jgi:hypothetical protein
MAGRALVWSLIAAMAMGGCGSDAPPAPQSAQSTPATLLSIGPDGALGITTPLPYRQDALAAAITAIPGVEVAAEPVQIALRVYTGFKAVGDGLEYFEFWPSADLLTLRAIHTESPAVVGPADDVIGSSTLRDAPQTDVAFCKETLTTGARLQECATDPAATFWRIYRLAPKASATGVEDLAANEKPLLVAMRWIAPGAAPAPQETFAPR